MAKRALQGLALVLAVILVGFVGYTAGAAGETAVSASQDGDRSYGERLHSIGQRLHSFGQRLHGGAAGHGHHDHGGGGFGHHMAEVALRLNLSPEQAGHLEAIHHSLESLGDGADGSLSELHRQLVEQFEQGDIDAEALRTAVDQHLAEVRRVAFSASDDLVALVNSLDADQREIVLEHLRGSAGAAGGGAR